MNKSDPLWVKGICDRILLTLISWAMHYHNGVVSATRPQQQPPTASGVTVIDVPTRYAVDVAWQQQDLDYLIKVLEARVPTWPVTRDLRSCFPRWRNGKLIPGGARVITLDHYFTDVTGMIRLMEALRDGKTKEAGIDLSQVDLSKYA